MEGSDKVVGVLAEVGILWEEVDEIPVRSVYALASETSHATCERHF